MRNFKIYTDGACKGNPGKGGFAYIIYGERGEIWHKGHGTCKNTTNNRMELYAAIEALKILNKNWPFLSSVELFSDSAYLVNCFNENWISKWEKNGWLTREHKDVANKECWLALKELVSKTNVVFSRVPRNNVILKRVDRKAKWASNL